MVPDGLGSVRSVTDNTAQPQETRFYDPYGELTQTSGSSQSVFGFTGEPTDSNGLVHLRARYYNPALGTFPNLDPFGGNVGSPMSLNRYSYVQGNTSNWTDPLGYGPEICLGALAGGPELALGCVGIVVGTAALAYFALLALRNAPPINLQAPGSSGRMTLDQAFQVYTQAFNSYEQQKSQVCSGLPPGGQREGCEQSYDQLEEQVAEQVLIPGFISEEERILEEAEKIVEKAFQKPQPKTGPTTMPGPFIPPLPPTMCSPTATATTTNCPSGSKQIEWPFPTWTTAGHGDTGASNLSNNRPGPILTKTTVNRGNGVTLYDGIPQNRAAVVAMGIGRANIHAHHKLPLFLGGPDTIDNLAYLTIPEHRAWHDDLRLQGVGFSDPIGTQYCITRYK